MPAAYSLADANFGQNPGFVHNPFVDPGSLLTAWDFRGRNNAWKRGPIGGQQMSSWRQFGGATVADSSSATYVETPDGLGVRLTPEGYLRTGYIMPAFDMLTGSPGRTFMAFGRIANYNGVATQSSVLMGVGWTASTNGIALGARHLNTGTQIGAAVEGSTMNHVVGTYKGKSQLIFLRQMANGTVDQLDSEFLLDLPFLTQNRSIPKTGAEISVANNPLRLSNGSPYSGEVYFGNFSPTLDAVKVEVTLWLGAVWNRRLTNFEIARQTRIVSRLFKPRFV